MTRAREDAGHPEGEQRYLKVNAMQDPISSNIDSFSENVAAVATSDNVLLGVKGLLVGSAYSLRKAHELGFNGNVSSHYPIDLDSISQDIAAGNLPERGAWLAGFFFNSILLRFAAAYHILLKRILGNIDATRKELSRKAIESGIVSRDDIDLLDKVYQDINDFKHKGGKLLRSRRVQSISDAITAGEKLILILGRVQSLATAQQNTPGEAEKSRR